MNLKLVEFNQNKTLLVFVRMIIIDELSRFVKNKGFRKFMHNPILKFSPVR